MVDRKQIDVPVELHDRFMEIHTELRPAEQAPKWYTLDQLLIYYEENCS